MDLTFSAPGRTTDVAKHDRDGGTATETPLTPSVLVVDDEETLARVIARGLKRAGFEVDVAFSAADALERLRERRFEVLLTDINMPRMRGDQLQRIARDEDPDLAVLLITAAQDIGCAVECLKEGVYDYMVKPTPLEDIAVRISKALERRALAIENRDYRLHLETRVREQAERLHRLLRDSLETLIQALEAKDEYTHEHSSRVAAMATALANHLRPDDAAWVNRVRVASLFHDIGKIGISEAILHKPSALSEKEWEQVRRHPEIGESILRPLLAREEEMLAIVRHHHERWDGSGYPDGLQGDALPLGARIVAVADAFDAMTSCRPYRSGMHVAQAIAVLQEGAGRHWDDTVVGALIALASTGRMPLTDRHLETA